MQEFVFNIPTKVIFGSGKIQDIQKEIPASIKNILIVIDQNLNRNTDIINGICMRLSNYNIFIFDKIEENPSIESVNKGALFSRKNEIRFVIGVGGGSAMDAAKGIALASRNISDFESYLNGREAEVEAIPLMCIPTTSGTGSEVTPFAVFTDKRDQSKKGFSHPSIFPKVSIIDPELSFSMPERVRVDTGLDVLAHSVEAYLSLDSNPLNDQIALHAIEQVLYHLPLSILHQKESINQMAYASMLAGVAITHASTILPHIMGYPLTVFHGLPHGRASILTLPAFLHFLKNVEPMQKKIEKLESLFNRKNGIKHFLKSLNVPTQLRDYGIHKSEFDLFVQKTIHKGDVKITPGIIDEMAIMQLYLDSY